MNTPQQPRVALQTSVISTTKSSRRPLSTADYFQTARSAFLPLLTTIATGCAPGIFHVSEQDPFTQSPALQQSLDTDRSRERLDETELNNAGLILLVRGDSKTFNHLRATYPEWTPDFRGAKVEIRYATNMHLSGADFSQANLYGTDFSGSDLRGAKFHGARLNNAHFDDAKLMDAEFAMGSRLDHATFLRAKLMGARFVHVSAVGVNFSRADLSDAHIDHCDMTGTHFTEGANLSGSFMYDTDFTSANFSHSLLRQARFVNARALGAQFKHSDLSHATLTLGDFSRAAFSYAHLDHINIEGGTYASAQFDHAQLSYANFVQAGNFHRANFADANLQSSTFKGHSFGTSIALMNTTFDRARLTRATFTRADIRGARLYKSLLHSTTFDLVDLRGVDFTDADLIDAAMINVDIDGIDAVGNASGLHSGDLTAEQISVMKRGPNLPLEGESKTGKTKNSKKR